MDDNYEEELRRWRQSLDTNLRKENSWLALAGLFWLEKGENSFGTDPENRIVFPEGSGPERIGTFWLDNDQVTMNLLPGIDVVVDGELIKQTVLLPDISGTPTMVRLENLSFILIQRENDLGIRLWDNNRPLREQFQGRQWYEAKPEYCIPCSYIKFAEERSLLLARKNTSEIELEAKGEVRFSKDGQDVSLLVFEQEGGELFIIFNDLTNGEDTYAAGRFLVADPPNGDQVIVDFNRAYNPPCAFTDFATCTLPPAENRLSVAIHAGERKPLIEV